MTRNLSIMLAACSRCSWRPPRGRQRFTIRGAGFGHGVGMSQYGAMGYAAHGWAYKRILGHYYTDTAMGGLDEPRTCACCSRRRAAPRRSRARRAVRAGSCRRRKTYSVRGRAGGRVELLAPSGAAMATVGRAAARDGQAPHAERASGSGRDGSYRGALEFRPGTFGGVNVINAVDVDDYVKGVVPLESPASWPIEALKAQAVAARTYALTTSKGGAGFDHYTDTRSQVYGGASVEQASTNAAATRPPASSSRTRASRSRPTSSRRPAAGRRTSRTARSARAGAVAQVGRGQVRRRLAAAPLGPDPHGPRDRRREALGARQGALPRDQGDPARRARRASWPAKIVGTGGRTRVDGATIRASLGLYDTWAYFTSIRTGKAPKPPEPAGPPTPVNPGTGGASPGAATAGTRPAGGLRGAVMPARRGARITLQRRAGARWVTIGTLRAGAGGRYEAAVAAAGAYRVRYRGDAGPVVRIG